MIRCRFFVWWDYETCLKYVSFFQAEDGIRDLVRSRGLGDVYKRQVPICWLVKKCKKGHLPAKMHLQVFTILHKLLKGYENVVVLGDGEFDNGEVVTACKDWRWRFVFRTAKNTKIYDGEEEYPLKNLGPPANEKFFIVHDVAYTKERYGPVLSLIHISEPTRPY